MAPDDPMLRWASGRGGTPPAITSLLFPYAGWMVMRSGWRGPDERYALLEAGPYGFGHQHEDKLNLIVYGYGREHVSDAGYYDYDASAWRRYVLSTRGHNTLRIDGQDQHRAGLTATYVTSTPVADLAWDTSPDLDYACGVYADGYGPGWAIRVTHRREVVFVKPDYFVVVDTVEGEGAHTIESLFHLNHDEADVEGSVARSVDPGVSNVLVAAAPVDGLQVRIAKGETAPEVQGFIPGERWHASWRTPGATPPEHGKREVPTVVYTLRARLPAKLAYVVMPYPAKQRPEVTCRLLPPDGEGTALEVTLPGGQRRVILVGRTVTSARRPG
ncbi:MAG: heparinase II/III-family protein [Armatimonadetes bacterium]|nr:heparinase II/III-family protein [Armatimonadota bacterium]